MTVCPSGKVNVQNIIYIAIQRENAANILAIISRGRLFSYFLLFIFNFRVVYIVVSTLCFI